jgi:CHAT domain-containing protein
MYTLFSKSTPSVFCFILTLLCFATPVFAQNPAIEAADKVLEIAKRDTTNAVPYATALRDSWQAYHNYIVAEKTAIEDSIDLVLIQKEEKYRFLMESLVKVSETTKGKALPKLWTEIKEKETFLYQGVVASLKPIDSIYMLKGNMPALLPHFKLLEILFKKLNDKGNYFKNISDLASVNVELGNYEVAQSILEKGIDGLRQELTHYDKLSKSDKEKTENTWIKTGKTCYVHLFTDLCQTLGSKGDFDAAILRGQQAVAEMKICLKDTSYKNADFGNPHYWLASFYNNNFKPNAAILIANEGLHFYEKASDNYSYLLGCVISAYYLTGDMLNIERTTQESCELAISKERKNAAILQLYLFYFKKGENQKAAKLLDEYAATAYKIYGKASYAGEAFPNIVKGIFYRTLGEYDKAERCVNNSIGLLKKLGFTPKDMATYVVELARIYDNLGQYDKSLDIKRQTHATTLATVFDNSRDRILSWSNLGLTYFKLNQLDSARLCYKQVCKLLETSNATKTADYITTTNRLGLIDECEHQYAAAEKWYQKAYAYTDSVTLMDVEDKDFSPSNLSRIYRKQGKNDKSSEKSQKSFTILRGLENTDIYRKAQLNRALLHDVQQQNAAAVDSLQSLFQNIQTRITKEFAYLSEQDKVAFMTMLDKDFFGTMQAAYARLYARGEAAKSGVLFYNTVLLQKELSLVDTRSLKRKAANVNDTLLFAQLFKLNAYDEQLKSDKPMPTAERERLTTETAQIKAHLEKTYPKLFEKESMNLDWKTVQRQLKPNEIAIEYADVLNDDDDTTSIRNYYALAVTHESKYPSVIPLFEEKELRKLLDDSRFYKHDAVTNAEILSDEETVKQRYTNKEFGKKLYDLIWQPLENSGILRGVKILHFAPSGLLNRVAFKALPIDGDKNKPLLEAYQLQQYNTTRALVETTPRFLATAKDLVVFGNINYGSCNGDTSKSASVKTMPLEKADGLVARSALFLDSTKIHWVNLPNSKRELDSLSTSHKKWQPNAAFTAFTNYDACEARFKTLGTQGKLSPSHLYISTHGFGNPMNYPESRYAAAALHRAGLAMATANWTTWCPKKRDPDEEDGILTAFEIAQLNLANTELVILSGCQTGLGDIWGREGVFGLTRGFKLAGVNHIIASLWKVPDAQTAEFMTTFYNAYLSGKSINDAFADTQRQMRNKQSVYSWGAWVLIR